MIKSIKQLEKIADRWFSLYIRLLYANKEGMVKCATCPKVEHYKKMDCGHFQSRRFKSTRYDKRNCSPQCTYCNRYQQGEQYKLGQWLKRFGENNPEWMETLARKICKRTAGDLFLIIEENKNLAKAEAKRLNIKI